MKKYSFKNNLKEFSVPKKLQKNIKRIYSTKMIIKEDINQNLADFLINEGGILNVVSKPSMSWADWKNLKESCKSCSMMPIENNGILMEFLCQYVIPNIFNIKSLVLYHNLDFETPESGNDLLFFDCFGNVFIYEVKSKLSNKFNHSELQRKIKKAYISLFCGHYLKNNKKINIARNLTEDLDVNDEVKDKIFASLEKIEDARESFIDLCRETDIFLNVCIVGNGFQYTEEELKNDLIEVFCSSKYCDGCKYIDVKNGVCRIQRLRKTIVLNIISIEFNNELNINDLNMNIIKIIDEKGLDLRC